MVTSLIVFSMLEMFSTSMFLSSSSSRVSSSNLISATSIFFVLSLMRLSAFPSVLPIERAWFHSFRFLLPVFSASNHLLLVEGSLAWERESEHPHTPFHARAHTHTNKNNAKHESTSFVLNRIPQTTVYCCHHWPFPWNSFVFFPFSPMILKPRHHAR